MNGLVAVCAWILFFGSGTAQIDWLPSAGGDGPAPPYAPAPAEAVFINASPQAGLAGVPGNFFAWGDYDNDGHQDLLVDGQRLFRNDGPPNWTFTEVTARAGIGGSGANCGNWADYDNDGVLDLFCPSGGWSTDYSPLWDILWHNNGDGTFTNVTEKAGHVTDTFPSVAAGWGDYDRDGFVDLYVANYENASMSSYYPDVLWRNNGDGTFTNVTSTAHVDESGDPKPGRGVSWCDYNNDGWPDIYVSNYRLKANYLYMNLKDGTFTNEMAAGIQGEPNYRPPNTYYGHSVGAAWSDIENDGDFDLWVTNLAHKDPVRGPICDDSELYRNDGQATNYTFTNIRDSSGIPTKRIMGGEDELFVGCCWGDYDNDGYEDLFLPQIYNDLNYSYSFLYRNNGDNTFTDVSNQTGVRVWDTYGGCFCDYDEDGDLDLITGGKGDADINGTHEIHFYKNMLNDKSDSTWLELRLKGVKSNTAAIGARILATPHFSGSPRTQMREVQGGMGPHSMQNSMVVHFGFPGGTTMVNLTIYWPSGMRQDIDVHSGPWNVSLNRTLDIIEAPTQADLTVTGIDFSPQSPIEGDTVRISATVQNVGNAPSTLYYVSISENESWSDGQDINETLNVGQSRVYSYLWDTSGAAGEHTIRAFSRSMIPFDSNLTNDSRYRNISVATIGGGTPPTARLSALPTSVVVNQTVNFDGSGSFDPDGKVAGYFFNFGDGASTGWTPSSSAQHAYTKEGGYTASLMVRDSSGLASNNSEAVRIAISPTTNRPPSAAIVSILPNPATLGQAVTFGGQASDPDGTVVNRTWESSIDGNLSFEDSFSTSALSAGTHTITFRCQDDRGQWSAPSIRTLQVLVPVPNKPPTAAILSISPSPARQGDMVTFTGSGDDEDGSIKDYRWSSSLQGIVGTGRVLKTSGLVVGAHTISLSVGDDMGAWSPEATRRLDVLEKEAPETANILPKAALAVTPLAARVGEPVHLDASNSTDQDGTVVVFFFDFGDGEQLCWTVANFADHAYSSPGQYIVRCRVRDNDGGQSAWTKDILVEVMARKAPPSAAGAFIPGMDAVAAATAFAIILAATRKKRLIRD